MIGQLAAEKYFVEIVDDGRRWTPDHVMLIARSSLRLRCANKQKKKKRGTNIRQEESEMQDKVKPKPLDLGTHFDVTKHIRLVPPSIIGQDRLRLGGASSPGPAKLYLAL